MGADGGLETTKKKEKKRVTSWAVLGGSSFTAAKIRVEKRIERDMWVIALLCVEVGSSLFLRQSDQKKE